MLRLATNFASRMPPSTILAHARALGPGKTYSKLLLRILVGLPTALSLALQRFSVHYRFASFGARHHQVSEHVTVSHYCVDAVIQTCPCVTDQRFPAKPAGRTPLLLPLTCSGNGRQGLGCNILRNEHCTWPSLSSVRPQAWHKRWRAPEVLSALQKVRQTAHDPIVPQSNLPL